MEIEKKFFNKKKLIGVLLIVFVSATLGAYFYWHYQEKQKELQLGRDKHSKILQEYAMLNADSVDFLKTSQEFEEIFARHPRAFDSKMSEGMSKIAWADSLSVIDREKGTEILKSIAIDSEYPNSIRAKSINYIINDFELDFIGPDFAAQQIFKGEFFENFLLDSNGDVELAIRKLNEWSNALYPNIIASYRIAKWYAAQIYKSEVYKNPILAEAKMAEFRDKMNEHVAIGDDLLRRHGNTTQPRIQGLAYELKARIIYLSGGDKEGAEELFLMAKEAYNLPPQSIFQRVYLSRSGLYYASFLIRNYGASRAEDIRALLEGYYDYYAVFQEPRKRGVRQVSFLIAARDSTSLDYPAVDFNKTDIEMIKKIYPEFGAIIDKLNLLEYAKDHPLEKQIRQIIMETD